MKNTPYKLLTDLYTKEELFQILLFSKNVEALQLIRDGFYYLSVLYASGAACAKKYNSFVVNACNYSDKNFNLKCKTTRSIIAHLQTIISYSEQIHKQCYKRELDLFAFSPVALEYMRCKTNMFFGNFVYFDDFLFIGWRPHKVIMPPMELFVFVKNKQNQIYTFLPCINGNVVPPISSIKKAKKALEKCKIKKFYGECLFDSSIKLCKILGLKVDRKRKTILLPTNCKKGF